MGSRRAAKSLLALAMGAILIVSIPLLGVLIAWPLWYLGTSHPAVYSTMVIGVVIGLVLRGIHQRR